ncbi:protein takeout-like [Onthophagus taurus]|uniref:protein takeout-like n=1 Tax=Onthophagus taurus TaxID=166361 RepID=UPI000C20226C|nr:protein takeout-like [Onthophagus taurus]
MKVLLSFVFGATLCNVYGLTLPSYMKQCSISDPNVNECFKTSGNNALESVLKGDRKYKIIKMNPLELPKVDLNSGGTFTMSLKDAVIKNLKSTKILNANIQANHWEFEVSIDPMIIESQYEINGRILILPITGNGPSKITLEKGIYSYVVDLKTIEKKGVEYLAIDKSNLEAKLGHVRFHFENLFNGDKRLGDQMNTFVNENWEEFLKELYPAMVKIMRTIVDNTITGYFSTIPKKDVYAA